MSDTANLLVELFVEELPPKALKKLGEAFAAGLADSLKAQGLVRSEAGVTAYATPRRLAVHVAQVLRRAADQSALVKLMPASVALDAQGQPTTALLKKLAALGAVGTPLAQLPRQGEGKAQALFLNSHVPGVGLQEGLQKALDETLAKLPIPKVMSYQLADGWSSVQFVRPAHGLVALHGDDLVPVQALGLTAGRVTQGHRFEASQSPIALRDADSYAAQLQDDGAVIADFAARRAEIVSQLQQAATAQGLKPIDDDALLDEVTGLVERPNVLCCEFEPQFLEVPAECLILTMKANQKYFPLLDGQDNLTNKFLVVSNIRPADPGRIVEGNQRVVRPRLADAKFFFDQDRKKTLASRVPGLDKVVYHGKLGTQGERVQRVRTIARAIGERLGGAALAASADRAALLAKADLLTDMVGEFPELQGIMGGYYARHDGESEDVAIAIEDHYKPRFAGDALPRNASGEVLALADKLETLAGLFAIGQLPTGDKDPFALRRHAIGVMRLLTDRSLPLPLDWLLDLAFSAFQHAAGGSARADLRAFMLDRLGGMLREQGYSVQEVEAVLAASSGSVDLVPRQLAAVRAFAALPEAASLAAANKRIANIRAKSGADSAAQVVVGLFNEGAERELYAALNKVLPLANACFGVGDYTGSLRELAALKSPVDAFFDQVMVNAEDPALRANRLALLGELHAAMNRVADLSKLAA